MILAQLNHHRTYLIGKDIALPVDGRMVFDIALRSNEAYPASDDLGEPTTFFGHDIGRDDPPVADYDMIRYRPYPRWEIS
ncbi:MAG: hypothetical protein GTN74_08205 [Proteobacteria bacterium]|nr:hypothetical protein [Pseudomonadota bacterium]NIS69786.1 hypothetical protein [Pseudomonadota bacterium]